MKVSLKCLARKEKRLTRLSKLLRMHATKLSMLAGAIRQEYMSLDYQLAEMDGRLSILKPKKENTRSHKVKEPKQPNISTLVDKMTDEQKEALLQQLLK